MLYGPQEFPWKGIDRESLSDNIYKYPLNFPKVPERSVLIKDLLVNLLEKNESKRLTWN